MSNFTEETAFQLDEMGKNNRLLSVAHMFVIAFTCLVVITQTANTLFHIGKPVLIVMSAAVNRWLDMPNNQLYKFGVCQWDPVLIDQLRRHFHLLHIV
ncbi:hypothetical protein D3C78_1513020 [compost metagenome]